MNRAEALLSLKSPIPHTRLGAARMLLRCGEEADYNAIAASRAVETVGWIRVALDAALIDIRRRMGVPPPGPVGDAPPEESVRRDIEALVTQQVTRQLLHEIEPLVGLARLHAGVEFAEYTQSRTRITLDQLGDLLMAIATLNISAGAPRMEEFDLAALVETTAECVRTKDGGPRAAGPQAFNVRGDPKLLGLAIVNGLRNAVEAVTLGGKAWEPNSVVVNWNSDDRDNWLVILDAGIGLHPGTADVFGIGVTTKEGHVGMGLSAVRRAMWSMGGVATLSPQDAGGCKLELRWPR